MKKEIVIDYLIINSQHIFAQRRVHYCNNHILQLDTFVDTLGTRQDSFQMQFYYVKPIWTQSLLTHKCLIP